MNINYTSIHETVLGAIISAVDELRKLADSNDFNDLKKLANNNKKSPLFGSTSISKAVSNMTLVFPVICSRGISIENSSMVSKALERNAVSMLQRLFAAYQISEERDVVNYVKQFHNNISSDVASLDDIYSLILASASIDNITGADLRAIKEDMGRIDFVMESDISDRSLSDYVIREGAATLDPRKRVGRHMQMTRGSMQAQDAKNAAEFFSKQVVDSDFKKANELTPTLMNVNFKVVDEESNSIISYDSALVGVKAKLYPIGSKDVVDHVSDRVSGRNWITNFFRATTREISFLKDFILAVDKAKTDALALSAKNPTADRMWKVLERRSTDSKFRRLMLSNNSAAAITTLCISQEEVEYMRKNKGIDVESLNVVRGLFESLNLMCICIVDETLEVAKFIYDENELMWETLSFNHLEREASDNAYKKVVNMMTKVSH